MKKLTQIFLLFLALPLFSNQYHYPPQQQYFYAPEARSLRSIGDEGITVELDDTSIWAVKPELRYVLKTWMQGDLITFCPNTTWNRGKFILLNNRTNGHVFVDPANGPFVDIPPTFVLRSIDYAGTYAVIQSNAGQICNFVLSKEMHSWEPGHIISIGLNNPRQECCAGGPKYYLYCWNTKNGTAAKLN
ncbi:MAG: hypothetical protein SNF33_07685 [Candidatus Algichlamydia australiensis]|nr:hypothetical protein [Chlamydiales bacterium]